MRRHQLRVGGARLASLRDGGCDVALSLVFPQRGLCRAEVRRGGRKSATRKRSPLTRRSGEKSTPRAQVAPAFGSLREGEDTISPPPALRPRGQASAGHSPREHTGAVALALKATVRLAAGTGLGPEGLR